jgi:hypothetical protein
MVGFSNTAFRKQGEVSEKIYLENDPTEQISVHLVKRMNNISKMLGDFWRGTRIMNKF